MKSRILIIFALLLNVGHLMAQSPKAKDLGLSVKWADRNIGASSPEQYGDYFSWGEVKVKRFYGKYSGYKHFDDTKFHKYNYYHFDGSTVDSLLVLKAEDDAASFNLGKKWRMPTEQEVNELFEKCMFKKSTLNGAKGYWVMNKEGIGDSIFIPLTGRKDYGKFRLYPATSGYYWTSTLVGPEVHDRALMRQIDKEIGRAHV